MSERSYDPELTEILAFLPTVAEWGPPESMPEARAAMETMFPEAVPRDDVVREDIYVPGHGDDPEVMVRLYKPVGEPAGLRPGVLEIHGGGFIMGTVAQMDGWCDGVAADLQAVVASVEYRLAPEDPYPAAIHDCFAALRFFADNAVELGVDANRIAIAGQSAGGGLAAGTSLFARDHGGPPLCFQLLEIPELDDRLGTVSMTEFVDTPLWNRPNAERSWSWYLGPDAERGDDVPIYASPSRATDLSGLPPAYVSVMEFDPLRDEGIAYASQLLAAGVSTELHAFPGTFHGSALVDTAAVSKRSAAEARRALRDGLNRSEENTA